MPNQAAFFLLATPASPNIALQNNQTAGGMGTKEIEPLTVDVRSTHSVDILTVVLPSKLPQILPVVKTPVPFSSVSGGKPRKVVAGSMPETPNCMIEAKDA